MSARWCGFCARRGFFAPRPFPSSFFSLYLLCGVSDVLDGALARRFHAATKRGALFDSIADFVFVLCVLLRIIPALPWSVPILWWIGGIAGLRAASVAVGLVRFRGIAMLHTYANKETGVILFSAPVLLPLLGFWATALLCCAAASLSVAEELLINCRAQTLWKDRPVIWRKLPNEKLTEYSMIGHGILRFPFVK